MINRHYDLLHRLINFLVAFFFLSLLIIPRGYNYVPAVLALLGFVYLLFKLIKRSPFSWDFEQKKLLISFSVYFLLFVASMLFFSGKLRQLDNPGRVILFFPILFLLIDYKLVAKTIFWAIPLAAFLSGVQAIYDRFYLEIPAAFSNHMLQIQAGDISMSLGVFSLCIALYWRSVTKPLHTWICIVFALFGILGSVLSTARGGWVGIPLLLIIILFVYRRILSKSFFLNLAAIILLGITSLFIFKEETRVLERVDSAYSETINYFTKNAGSTSVGARFDMWKSALLAVEEKPIFGWGIDAITELRQKQAEQKIISDYAGQFNHAHNQFLDDASKRGILGLMALLGVFFIPLQFFIKTIRQSANNKSLTCLGLLGIVHVISVMCYGLTQTFFSHNSGNIFYFFVVIVLYAAINNIKNEKVQ